MTKVYCTRFILCCFFTNHYPLVENMIYKGLDDEEARFLNIVSEKQAEAEEKQILEEMQEIKQFRVSTE